MTVDTGWAIEEPPNPTVLGVHVRTRLTDRTILTCPPHRAAPPFDRLLGVEGVRSVDLHPYRLRVNLRPGGDRRSVAERASALLEAAEGPATALGTEPMPRAFAHPYTGARKVAESREMARSSSVPVVAALFDLIGVSEVVIGPGLVLVRIGRLFDWGAMEPGIVAAVTGAQ